MATSTASSSETNTNVISAPQAEARYLIPAKIMIPPSLIDSVANCNRHKPICEKMFKELGIRPVSEWVKDFEQDLFPWGGHFRFKKDSNWFDGPVDSSAKE